MKRWILPLLLLGLAFVSATAQEPEPKPVFNNAPITDVLVWAQRDIGCGFMYEGAVLRDAEGQVRTVTASHVQPTTRAERTVLLFELLRAAGLVAFEVGGLPGPTYQLHEAIGAARAAPLFTHPEEADGTIFAGLTIRLQRALAAEVASRIRPRLTEGVGAVEVFEGTQTLVVTDYTDRLVVAWGIAQAAEKAGPRVDDLIVRDMPLRHVSAERAAAALERLREPRETWKLASQATANVLLVSGQREEVERVLERAERLDTHDERPEFAETTYRIKLTYIEPVQAVRTLREMFQSGIQAGSIQLGAFDRERAVVLRGSEYDYRRALETLTLLDVQREGRD